VSLARALRFGRSEARSPGSRDRRPDEHRRREDDAHRRTGMPRPRRRQRGALTSIWSACCDQRGRCSERRGAAEPGRAVCAPVAAECGEEACADPGIMGCDGSRKPRPPRSPQPRARETRRGRGDSEQKPHAAVGEQGRSPYPPNHCATEDTIDEIRGAVRKKRRYDATISECSSRQPVGESAHGKRQHDHGRDRDAGRQRT